MISEQLREGTLLNERYRILKVLGQGGMGTVYLAEHTRLDTYVAVKEVCGVLSNTAELREALTGCEQEGRLLVRLHHPNLPQVTDAFVENDRFYLVMEYIEGETLEAKLREQGGQPLHIVSVVNWGVQIASVLKYLHEQHPPIIFRDLKPANIMVLADGTVRLIDFGIARRFQKGAVADTDPLGSVGYSPPEQFGDRQTDPRSDIYSFGATLHQLLTGRHPSSRPFKFIPARSINPDVPGSLSALLNRCVAEDPQKRPASMNEVVRSLEAIRANLPAAISDIQTGSLSSFRLYLALSRGTTRLFRHRYQRLVPVGVTALGICALAYFAYLGTRGQIAVPLSSLFEGKRSAGSQQTTVPSRSIFGLEAVGYVALSLEAGLSDRMEYWFESESAPKSSPLPLANVNAQGAAAVGVPAVYMKSDTQLVVHIRGTERIAKIPLAKLYIQYQRALAAPAASRSQLENGDFGNGKSRWKLETLHTQAGFTLRPLPPALAAKGVAGKAAMVTLPASRVPNAQAHLVHTELELIESDRYHLRFWGRADSEREIGLLTRLNTLGGGSSGLDSMVSLSGEWQPFDLTFTVSVPPSQRQKQTVEFRFTPTGAAQQVFLAGSFNGWNPGVYRMTRMSDNKTWQTTVPLDAGRYQYKFVVDGKDWFTDPDAPEEKDGHGNVNSLITVPSRPASHRLSFVLGQGKGNIQIAGVTVLPEDNPTQTPVAEDINISILLTADDFQEFPD